LSSSLNCFAPAPDFGSLPTKKNYKNDVKGIAVGTASISYTASGCTVVTTVTVNTCPTLHENEISGGTQPGLKIFPNPNNGSFTMTLSSGSKEEAQITITNVVGTKIREFTIPANKPVDILLEPVPGIYFLSATTSQEKYVEKLVVR
jgi:hypothetical protein